MARNETFIGVAPERVFEQLSDGWSYARWVVGTSEVRHVDEDWPSVGSRIHPTIRMGLLESKGVTTIEDATPPWQLTMRAASGPFGTAVVSVRLRPDGRGTRATLIEDPASRLVALNPAVHVALAVRNTESLRRLRALAEGGG